MKIWGKIVGGTAGFALGGPIAALLGVMAGHAVDQLVEQQVGGSDETALATPADPKDHPGLREIAFTIGVIALGAKLAKVDGEVTSVEIDAFGSFFHVPPGEERNVRRFFDLAQRDAAGFEPYARQVAALFPDAPEILENVLEGLFDIAKADGMVSSREALRHFAALRMSRAKKKNFRLLPHIFPPNGGPGFVVNALSCPSTKG